MILKTVTIPITPKVFDEHFADFILKWKIAKVIIHNLSAVRLRYEVHIDEPSSNTKFVAEIERIPLSGQRLEIRVSACNINPPHATGFIDAFNSFLYYNWKVSILGYLREQNSLLPLATAIIFMLQKFNIPKDIILKKVDLDQLAMEGYKIEQLSKNNLTVEEMLSTVDNNPDVQSKKNMMLAELNKRLPPVDAYKTFPGLLAETYVPHQKKALDNWKKAWKIIKKMKRDYHRDYEIGYTKTPEPSYADYQDALIKIYNRKIDRKTIGGIIEAGEAGLLE